MFRASPLSAILLVLLLAGSAAMPSVVVLASGRLVARLPALAGAGINSPAAREVTELEDPELSANFVAAAQHHREGVFDRAVSSAAGLLLTRLTGVAAGVVLAGFHCGYLSETPRERS